MLLLLPLNFLWLRGSAAYCTWWSAVMGKTLHHSHIQVTLVTLWSHTLEWSNIQYCHNSTLEHLRQRRVNRLELTSSNQEEGLICGSITSQSTPLTRETHTHKQKHTEVNTNTLTQHHLHIQWTQHICYSLHFCLHAVKQTVKLLTQRNILT